MLDSNQRPTEEKLSDAMYSGLRLGVLALREQIFFDP